MALTFEQEINLTTYTNNPSPKIVKQLSIIHEARNGEIVQYYIDPNTHSEGDKNAYAPSFPVVDEYGNIDHYDYVNYNEIIWNNPSARITRQKIDRLGLKAFPNVGAIAFYKLAYRTLSRVVAPVNYEKGRQIAPVLAATVSPAKDTVTFTLTDPIDPYTGETSVKYLAYRICMVLDYHQLEFITYEKTLTVGNFPVSGTYQCYAIGYLNEGEICSYDSNSLSLDLVGLYSTWPAISPGNKIAHQSVIQVYIREEGTPYGTDWLSRLEGGSALTPSKETIYVVCSDGMYKHKAYYWDGTAYKLIGVTYTLDGDNQTITLLGSDTSSDSVSIVPIETVITLAAADWDTEQKQTVSVSAIKATSYLDLLPLLINTADDITNNIALQNANIMECSHTAGSLTVYAANLPTEDLLLRLRIR